MAFPFAVDTAAVLLAVEPERLGQMATIGIAFPEVGIEEFQVLFMGNLVADFMDDIMLLVGADEQGGGESAEALLPGNLSRF